MLSNCAAKVLLFIDMCKFYNKKMLKKLHFLRNLLKINSAKMLKILHKIQKKHLISQRSAFAITMKNKNDKNYSTLLPKPMAKSLCPLYARMSVTLYIAPFLRSQ